MKDKKNAIINGKVKPVNDEKEVTKMNFIKKHSGKIIAYAAGIASSVVVMIIKGKASKHDVADVEVDDSDYEEDEDFEENNEAPE